MLECFKWIPELIPFHVISQKKQPYNIQKEKKHWKLWFMIWCDEEEWGFFFAKVKYNSFMDFKSHTFYEKWYGWKNEEKPRIALRKVFIFEVEFASYAILLLKVEPDVYQRMIAFK